MKGAIVVNGYYSSPASENQASRLKEELRKLGAETEIIKNDSPFFIGEKFGYDFAVFFDKDVNLARNMEESGTLVFNSSFAIENTDDKIKTALILERDKSIVTPMTVPSPKKYRYFRDDDFLRKLGEKLGYPIVVKEARGSLGDQVYLAENFDELVKIDEKTGNTDKLFQQFVSESRGRSVRAIVVGKKYLCAMLLENAEDFRSNANNGGKGICVDVDETYVKTAEKVAELFDLDYCGVDFFAVAPIVIEVNSNAYFETIEKTTGENVALRYAQHIIRTTKEYIECRNSHSL
ncbi:MAG: RimK family alpha-L-glutamate ligase [Christensenellales bacterium]